MARMKGIDPRRSAIRVRITQPAHATLAYAWDEAASALRVTGLQPAFAGAAGDGGEVAMGPDASPLPAVVLGLEAMSAAPGSLIDCELLGAALDAEGHLVLLVWAIISNESPPDVLDDAWIAALTPSLVTRYSLAAPIVWLDAEAARTALDDARLAARQAGRTRAAGIGDYDSTSDDRMAAWRVPEGVNLARARVDGIGIFDAVPALLTVIPYRFQRYLTELLLADEQVLFFAERLARREREGMLGWRQRRIPAGILLVTEWRMLWLEDAAPPDATLVQWGYTVSVAPLGRLTAVIEVGLPRQIDVRLEARQGQTSWHAELPNGMEEAVAFARDLLAGFLPATDGLRDRRVRRVLPVTPWLPDAATREHLRYLGGILPERQRTTLDATLQRALGAATVLARAVAPALAEFQTPPTALALTADALWIAALDRRGEAGTVRRIDLAEIAAAQLRHSLLGCALTVVLPRGEQEEAVVIPFHSPAIAPYRALFTRLCLLLHRPLPTLHRGG
jgi:hypothetical protein